MSSPLIQRRRSTPPATPRPPSLRTSCGLTRASCHAGADAEHDADPEAHDREERKDAAVEAELHPVGKVEISSLRREEADACERKHEDRAGRRRRRASRFRRGAAGRCGRARRPIAARSATSRVRWADRASSRLAAFAHAIRSTNETALIINRGGGSVSRPENLTVKGSAPAATLRFVSGNCADSADAMEASSARAASSVTPSARRP